MSETSVVCRVRLIGGPKDGWVYDDIPMHWELTPNRMDVTYEPPTAIRVGNGAYHPTHKERDGTWVYVWERPPDPRQSDPEVRT